MMAHVDNAVANRGGAQTRAAIKGVALNFGDAVWNGDVGEASAILKCLRSQIGDAVRDRDGGQGGTFLERVGINESEPVAEGDVDQVRARPERGVSELG